MLAEGSCLARVVALLDNAMFTSFVSDLPAQVFLDSGCSACGVHAPWNTCMLAIANHFISSRWVQKATRLTANVCPGFS